MMSIREVKAFQVVNFDWAGNALRIDGDFGPKTGWAYAVACTQANRRAAMRRACSHVGVKEITPNRGQLIDEWVERCGVELGSPWCACFCSWCLSVANEPAIRIAGAMALGNHFAPVPTTEPAQAADIFYYPTDDKGHGHVELAISDEEDGFLATVGGNQRNAVRSIMRARRDGLISRPFFDPAPFRVPLPRRADGSPALELVRASAAGTR